jgi:branched-chain amino acid transport system permease protein
VTLSFGLLVDTVVFSDNRFSPGLGGVPIGRPGFALGDTGFAYLCLVILALLGLAVVNLRRSTTGLAITAVRWSEPAARTLGLGVVPVKLLLAGFAAAVAGIGGAVLAMYNQTDDPSTYVTFGGLIWLAIVVTVGLRSVTAAVIAGLVYTVVPGLFTTYLPASWVQVPTLLFGLGAIGVAVNPDGVVAVHARQLRRLLFERTRSGPAPRRGGDVQPAVVGVSIGADPAEGGEAR